MLTGLNFLQHTQQWICSKFSLKMPQHLKCLDTVIYDLPLITVLVSNCLLFSDITILQASVASRLRCGGTFSYHFTANLSPSLTVKEFWKLVKIWQSYRCEFGGPPFLEHSVGSCCSVMEFCQVQNSLCVLQVVRSPIGSVTARQSSSGHEPNFAALSTGRHLYSAGRPSRWALAHILVSYFFV